MLIFCVNGLASAELSSKALVCAEGMASSTVSKPENTCRVSPGPSVRSCQHLALSTSRSTCITRVSRTTWFCATRGTAHCLTSAFMPGLGTQCGSRTGRPPEATRPSSSSTRTVVALQGLHTLGVVFRACTKRGSRTVKYCVPWSNVPNAVLRVAMRPPTPRLFSNTVTSWPACTRVRAQVMPAMPAPMTAIFLDLMGLGVMTGISNCCGL